MITYNSPHTHFLSTLVNSSVPIHLDVSACRLLPNNLLHPVNWKVRIFGNPFFVQNFVSGQNIIASLLEKDFTILGSLTFQNFFPNFELDSTFEQLPLSPTNYLMARW
jgi:hypothetical protein